MKKQRESFKSQWGFILACIGSSVGMGNIWRFPYMVSDWGGMTFLLPYVLFVVLIASTGVIEEMALGRAAKSGPIRAFGKCTEIRTGNKRTGEVIGVIPVLGSLALAIGYTVVVGWIFKYAFLAITGGLFRMGQDMDAIGGLFDGTASSFGNNLWQVIAMIVTGVIMAYGIAGGIEKANAPTVCIVSGTWRLHFHTAGFRTWIPVYFYIESTGAVESEIVDLCFRTGIFLPVHRRKRNRYLRLLSE